MSGMISMILALACLNGDQDYEHPKSPERGFMNN